MTVPPALPSPEPRSALLWRVAVLLGGLLTGLFFLSCEQVDLSTAPPRVVSSADYEVYDAVLDSLFGARAPGDSAPPFVIADSTTARGMDASDREYVRTKLGARDAAFLDATYDAFTDRGTVRVPLEVAAFRRPGQVLLDSPASRTASHADTTPTLYWSDFYHRYPGAYGLITFSQPGYDATRTHALLAYGHGCGGLCGDWGYVLLERRDGRWTVLQYVVTMVS